ncbi:MAG: polyprenyl synthetase family protein [Neisseriales bacterium]|nr:MAG: polyprenyl synthetase family protein [Neisseriales bacterium]
MTEHAFEAWMRHHQMCVNRALTNCVLVNNRSDRKLTEAMAYVALGEGKRVRALLVFASGTITHAASNALAQVACAIELIHAYSLVHDDMPCMDDDVWRRDKPACHIAFGEAIALLTGDALQSLAFEVLSNPLESVAPNQQLTMIHLLSQAIGQEGMAQGQAIDLTSTSQFLSIQQLQAMHQLKTGRLIQASILLGALCGQRLTASQHAALNEFAESVGLLFQVTDDILDDNTETFSVPSNGAQCYRPTYVRALGLAGAKKMARTLHHDALDCLHSFDAAADMLRYLADYIAHRTF